MKTLTQDELTVIRNQAIESLAKVVVDANIECAKMDLDEGLNVEIRTYGTDRTSVEAYVLDFIDGVVEEVKEIQSKL